VSDAAPGRPLPRPSPMTQGYWDAARRHELVIQRCQDCRRYRHYPRPLCPACGSARWEWSPVSGRGVIYTFTVTHRAFHPAWQDRTPYAVVTVELEEGVRMVGELAAGDTGRVAIGLPVQVVFRDLPGEDVTLPGFRLR
jgi:uncharacterized protein